MDWKHWHQHYEVAEDFRSRLRLVGDYIAAAVNDCPAGPVRIVSMCAGDGRDVIQVLISCPRRQDVTAWLLDTDLPSLERGRAMTSAAGLQDQVRFLNADAALGRNYQELV